VIQKLKNIYARRRPPAAGAYTALLERANTLFEDEDEDVRPRDDTGVSGGVVLLNPARPTLVLPDIHARMEFILTVLLFRPSDGDLFSELDPGDNRIIDLLLQERIQLVCVGDYVHGEARVIERWIEAFREFTGGYKRHKNMDAEMSESLGAVEMLLELKLAVPNCVHLLKGNHENIRNEQGGGNLPFGKFAYEGAMVADYMERFYPEELVDAFYRVEKNYPLLTVGNSFLVTHAEPARFFRFNEVRNYRRLPEVVQGLTWTANDESEPGSVARMLEHYLGSGEQTSGYHFGGHRPIQGIYNLRADGRYVQLHNPDKYVAAMLPSDRPIDLSRDIVELRTQED